VVRRGALFLDDGERIVYSFALRLALHYLKEEGVSPRPDADNPRHLRLGQSTLRPLEPNDGGYVGLDARGYQFLLDFKEARDNFPSHSLSDLLDGKIEPDAIKDKIALLGVTARSVKDLFQLPHDRGARAGRQDHGVILHARIIDQLLRIGLDESAPTRFMPDAWESVWMLLCGVAGGLLGLRAASIWRFATLHLAGFIIIFLTACLAFLNGIWIPSAPPAMAWLLSGSAAAAYMTSREKKQRARLMRLFSKQVSREVAETIWRRRDDFLDGGRPRSQKVTVTILFSDLKGFTPVAERMTPGDLMDWLNAYMESMTRLVMEHGGVVDNFVGDAIKADFGVPIPRTSEEDIRRDALNAVRCALAMEKEIHRLNARWREKGLPAVGARVGIFTGPAVAGLLGGSRRMKYTTLGDTVNIASRLESYDKSLAREAPCRILIGESTLRYLDDRFKTRPIGEVSLKGKDEKIRVYRVIGKGK
ncbi:MAG: CHASE2 domain-containing protein, partial [Desulfobacterales bacterium]|nr:CHASE2 domain-containing protein [Desulfobacterales bacterium]